MGNRAGRQLGNYRLLSPLGQGGFAEVYLGEHVFLKKAVAIKVLYTQLGKDDPEGFLKEAQTIAHLEHPHIVRVTDFGLDGDLPYLVMEYAPNGTLRQRHPRDSTLPFATISTYVKQVAAALQYAHDEKLVHRDIKPENMLLNRNNELLLSDFGLATVAHRTATQNTQTIAGTAVYMAPELFRGKYYVASDQYALGIVVYEWLTGQPPFNEGDFIQLGFQHSYVLPEPLSEKNPAIPKDVEHVVMTALAKDPKQRFGSVKAFANALEQACMATAATQKEEEAEAAPPPVLSVSAKEETQPPSVQSRSAPLSPVPSSVVQEIPPSQPALPPIQNAPPASTPVVSMQIAAPDNQFHWQNQNSMSSSVPSVSTGGVVNKQQSLVTKEYMPPMSTSVISTQNSSQQEETKPVVGNLSALAQPKQKVSRRTVLLGVGIAGLALVGGNITWFAVSRGNLGKQQPTATAGPQDRLPTATTAPQNQLPTLGTSLITYAGHSDQVTSVAWAPDGQRIASGSYDGTIQVWNASDGSHTLTYTGHSLWVFTIAWSPDGQRIASGGSDTTVQVWNATDGSHLFTYTGHSDGVHAVAWSPDGKHIASGSYDKTVQMWNATDGSHAFTYTGHSDAVYAVAWSPDGKHAASGGYDETVQVWNATDGSHAFTYTGHSDQVTSVAWAHDGQRIASGSYDKTTQVWNASDGSHAFTYAGHSNWVNSVAWSPDGQRIASGSSDTTIQVWNAIDGSHAFTYTGHFDEVTSVAWAPNGQRIASGSSDKTVQVCKAR